MISGINSQKGKFDKCFKKNIAFPLSNGVFINRYNAFNHRKAIFLHNEDTFYLNELCFSVMFLYIAKIIILPLKNDHFNRSLK